MSNQRPLIVHVIHHLVIGGMENGLVNLINHMPESSYRHAILCIEDFSDFRQRIQRPDVEVVALRRSVHGIWRLRRALFSHFRRLRPSIVHTRGLSGLDALAPARLAGVRHLVHGEHGWDVDNLHGTRWKPRMLRRIHSPLVERYVAVSLDLKRFLVEMGIDASRVTCICNGVDTERFRPESARDLRWLPEAFTAGPVLRVGTVGRLQPVKDQATLLRAAAEAMNHSTAARDSLRVVIVGDGPLLADLRQLAESLRIDDRCFFARSRGDIPDVMRCFDLFVLTSLNEGISNTILEAMATGLPLIVTGVGGNTELVTDGDVGTHFRPGDVDALAALLVRYQQSPELRRRQALAARQRAVEHFSLVAMVAAYRRLYDSVLGVGES